MQGDRERCLQAGMDDYIAKPVAIANLEQVLERWVGAARSSPESSTRG
jgi:CheY-like chemotaxis protein